jgi:two-component system, cell cycle sensor histidine kinase and response regulator CckA
MSDSNRSIKKGPREPDEGSDPFIHDDVECRIFRALADGAFVAKAFTDSKGILRYVNHYFATLLGYSPEELVGQHISMVHTPDQTETSKGMIEESVRNGASGPQEHWYLHRDGTVLPLLVGCVSISSAEGAETYTAMSGVDISPVLRARKEYQTLFDEMLDVFSHFEVLFDESGQAVDYRYLSVNPAWEKARGQRAEEVIGKTLKEVMPDHDPVWIEMAGQVSTTGKAMRTEIYSDALDKHFEATVFRPSPGECAVILQDITDERKAEAHAANLSEQLARAQRMESVGRLAGGVAHDFNNMLTVILGHVERNLGRIERSDPLYPDLEEIGQMAERSADLTRRLLTFARNQPSSPRVIDLNESIDAVLTILGRLIGEDIDLTWRPGIDLASVRIDPSQIDQVLANLCVNARDAIEDVGEIIIETSNVSLDEDFCSSHPGHVPGDYVELTVTDNGSGMDADTLEHLFEPFFTTKEPGQGTGLGLSTVYGMVKQNQGSIDVSSEPGVGTTFRIFLPQHPAEPDSPPEQIMVDSDAHGTETILLVEDEIAILTIVTNLLENQGYTVLAAETPEEAISLAEEHPGSIDLLLTDVIMPEMNGHVLAERLRSSKPSLKCLFMSGYSKGLDESSGTLDCDVHFIPKPFSQKELSAKVREVLDS